MMLGSSHILSRSVLDNTHGVDVLVKLLQQWLKEAGAAISVGLDYGGWI